MKDVFSKDAINAVVEQSLSKASKWKKLKFTLDRSSSRFELTVNARDDGPGIPIKLYYDVRVKPSLRKTNNKLATSRELDKVIIKATQKVRHWFAKDVYKFLPTKFFSPTLDNYTCSPDTTTDGKYRIAIVMKIYLVPKPGVELPKCPKLNSNFSAFFNSFRFDKGLI